MANNTQQNQTGNNPGEVESDSGDSLFLTQKPVPKAVRSGRSHRLSQRSTPISPRFLEESGSSSDSSEDDHERRKPQPLPKYSFPFLEQKKHKSSFSSQSNKIIHFYAMGGFFKCVQELYPLDEESKSDQSLLPAADEWTEEITPLTEEEMSDEEDIKIVSKSMFVYALQPRRTKSSRLNPQKEIKSGKVTSKKDSAKTTIKRTPSDKRDDLQRHPSLNSEDSDATLIEESRSIAQKDVSENLTELQLSAGPVSGLCPTEELDNTESQSILQNITADITDYGICKERRLLKTKKKKHKSAILGDEIDSQDTFVNGDIVENQERTMHYDNIVTKKTKKCIAENDHLHKQPENVSRNTENGVSEQILNEDVEKLSSCLVETLITDDSILRKKKKKHKKKKGDHENAELETGKNFDPEHIVNNVQLDNTDNIQMHKPSDKRKKHKNKQKASDNCMDQEDVSPKKHKKRLKRDEMSLSESVENHKQCELVNLKPSATDSVTTQSDESVSVRKKKKKKRRESFVDAETVENSHLPLSQSGDGDRADTLGISTNETESVQNVGQMHKPVLELGNSVKKKKKKHRHDKTGVYNNGSDNEKAIESSKISGKDTCTRNESENCDGPEVACPLSDECEQVKKKKKKSKHEIEAEITDVQQTSSGEEGESSIKSPNTVDVIKKKKRKHYDNDVDEGKTVETTELEQSTVKRKKHKKDRIKHDHPDVSGQSWVEMTPSSGSKVKNKSQTNVKKTLYNPNDNHLDES